MSTTGESAIIRQPIKNEVDFGETSAAVTRYKYITVEHVYVCNVVPRLSSNENLGFILPGEADIVSCPFLDYSRHLPTYVHAHFASLLL